MRDKLYFDPFPKKIIKKKNEIYQTIRKTINQAFTNEI